MDKKRKRQLLQTREDLIAQLYEECTATKDILKWSQFEPIYEKLTKVIEIEKDLSKTNVSWNREERLNDFTDWLEANGVEISQLEVSYFPDYGMGLKAKRDVEKNQCFLTVPSSIIITTETVLDSPSFGPLVVRDELLRSMPNVAMALFILHERFEPTWKAYLDILPNDFQTPLYFDIEQLNRLKSSATFGDVLTHIQRIARQYCYLHNLLKSQTLLSKLVENFSYDAYRWAVSVVSTRVNNVLDKNGKSQIALIPLMDFVNHCFGEETIHFDPNRNLIECQTMANVKAGEQIFMFYGKRTNAEYFIHNGFVPNELNPHDNYFLRLTLPKSDSAFEIKKQLLERYGLGPSERFVLLVEDGLLNPSIFIFIKIFLMNDDEVSTVYGKNMTIDQFFDDFKIDQDSDIRSFLKTRLSLLLRPLNLSLLNSNDSIDRLLISEHDILKKVSEKLDL